jgi:hypothetical protein
VSWGLARAVRQLFDGRMVTIQEVTDIGMRSKKSFGATPVTMWAHVGQKVGSTSGHSHLAPMCRRCSGASLGELYNVVREYMEIDGRVQVLNEKLGVASDFVRLPF